MNRQVAFFAVLLLISSSLIACGGDSAGNVEATSTRAAEQTEVAEVRVVPTETTSLEPTATATTTPEQESTPVPTPTATAIAATPTPSLTSHERNYLYKLDATIGDALSRLDQGIVNLESKTPPTDEAAFFTKESTDLGNNSRWGSIPGRFRDVHMAYGDIMSRLAKVDITNLESDESFSAARDLYAQSLSDLSDLDAHNRETMGLSDRPARAQAPLPTPVPKPVLPLASFQPSSDELGGEYEVDKAEKVERDGQPDGFIDGERLRYAVSLASFEAAPLLVQVTCVQFESDGGAEEWMSRNITNSRSLVVNVSDDGPLELAADSAYTMSGLFTGSSGTVFNVDNVWFRQDVTACNYYGFDDSGPWLHFMIDMARRVSDRTASQ